LRVELCEPKFIK